MISAIFPCISQLGRSEENGEVQLLLGLFNLLATSTFVRSFVSCGAAGRIG